MKPTKTELVETARRIRAMSPYSEVDSTDLIREDRQGMRTDEAWAAADAIRKKIGKVSGDSTNLIRQDRDNDERYR